MFSGLVSFFAEVSTHDKILARNLFWGSFLVIYSVVSLGFFIGSSNEDYDKAYCRKCDRPRGYQTTRTTCEKDTDKNGIPLLDGRKMIYTTETNTCRFCGDCLEETTSHLYDPATDTGGE